RLSRNGVKEIPWAAQRLNRFLERLDRRGLTALFNFYSHGLDDLVENGAHWANPREASRMLTRSRAVALRSNLSGMRGMSILGAIPPEVSFTLILLIPCAGAFAMMVKLGVFRGETIQGPERIGRDESALQLAILVFTSMLISAVVSMALHPLFKGEDQGT